jgi:hypothetical protein
MVTISGHFGLAPIASQRGDVVFLLLGCDVPLVLRAIERNKYYVIGGCYLHGFLEGEQRASKKEEGRLELETIDLC